MGFNSMIPALFDIMKCGHERNEILMDSDDFGALSGLSNDIEII